MRNFYILYSIKTKTVKRFPPPPFHKIKLLFL
jgi:hypothetical protein